MLIWIMLNIWDNKLTNELNMNQLMNEGVSLYQWKYCE